MKSLKAIFFLLTFSFSLTLLAQEGTLRGTVTDSETGETLPFATVVLEGTTTGAQTDLDGKYFLNLPAGTHRVVFTYTGYADQLIPDVEIIADEVTTLDIALGTGAIDMEEIVVEAKQIRNTEAAINTIKRKSSNLLDGISSQLISRTGDSDAGEIAKRVTGVSIEGGKHVYVRGLGDRYTKTILNGMEIPGLDPDRNSVQMDIFPSNLINNLVVYKTFTPDLSGDFTGGVVNVETKDFPESKTLSASIGYGYNPNMHFNKNFILSDGGKLDFLGFDDGTRKLPFGNTTKIPDPALNDPNTTLLTNQFNPQLGVQNKNNFLNQSYAFSFGNQINKEKSNTTLGYNFALNYKNDYEFYEGVIFGEYFKDFERDGYELQKEQVNTGDIGRNNVLWSALAVGAIKKQRSKYSLSLLHIQNGQSTATKQTQQNFESTGATLLKDNLTYSQRSVTNALFSAKHSLKNEKWEMDWKISPTLSKITDPDVRTTAFSLTNGLYTLNPGDGGRVTRIFRDLQEIDGDMRWNMTYNFKQWNELGSKLKFGIANTTKMRDFEILNYLYRYQNNGDGGFFTGNPDDLLLEENIWDVATDEGMYIKGNFEPANSFEAVSNVGAAYIMNELPLSKQLKMVYGLRIEKSNIWYTGESNDGLEVYNAKSVLDEIDFLPSMNMVYNINDMMNLRASYAMTLARPSFKEKSIAQIYDPVTDRFFIGNIDLQQTHVNNLDIRWEKFFLGADLISLSGFYKHFNNPIELVAYELDPSSIQPRNVGQGQIFGAEIELKKSLGFISTKISDLSIHTNFTYVYSQIEMSEEEFSARQTIARDGEVVSNKRSMQGQSPYIVNAGLNYSNSEMGLEANVSYNVQGKRLAIVGGTAPDVFESPFHSLNTKLSQRFGKENRFRLSVSANNLLGSTRNKYYENFQATPALYEYLNPGRSFSLGFSYTMQ